MTERTVTEIAGLLLHIADDAAFIERLAVKSADVIETLLAERVARIQVDLHRFALTGWKPPA